MTDAEKQAAAAAEAERQRVAAIMRQINEIDQKIREANKVKGTLSNCKSSLDSEIESWKNVRTALNSDVRYTQIVTTDVFEGEMANRLKIYMSTVVTDINTGISDSSNLLGELEAQISALVAYEGRLSAKRAGLVSQL